MSVLVSNTYLLCFKNDSLEIRITKSVRISNINKLSHLIGIILERKANFIVTPWNVPPVC